MKIKALGMFSGGLDSALAAHLVDRLGVEVEGVKFITGFSPLLNPSSGEFGPREAGDAYFKTHTIDISKKFLNVVQNPKYGYGSQLNPCVDCKILMLQQAKRLMKDLGARFVFTGEVLGQRPMSQHRQALKTIEMDSGLAGFLLRPLSAKLLDPTVPETKGWINREDLLNFQGRSRKPQLQLAQAWGIKNYAQPAGGCLLADENYCRRLEALIEFKKDASISLIDIELLKIGRIFHIKDRMRLILGRNEKENQLMLAKAPAKAHRFIIKDYPSPIGLADLKDPCPSDQDLVLLASITAFYSDAKEKSGISVEHAYGERKQKLKSIIIDKESLAAWRI